MVDPLSVAGVAIGGVSLAFQVFDGCIKGIPYRSHQRDHE